MITKNEVLQELNRSRYVFEELNQEEFFAGVFSKAEISLREMDILSRTNVPNNMTIRTDKNSSIILDRRWFEHALTIATLQSEYEFQTGYVDYGFQLGIERNEENLQRIMDCSLGYFMTVRVEYFLSQDNACLFEADNIAESYLEYIDAYKRYQKACLLAENPIARSHTWLSYIISCMAYCHEIGHDLKSIPPIVGAEFDIVLEELLHRAIEQFRHKVYEKTGQVTNVDMSKIFKYIHPTDQFDSAISNPAAIILGLKDQVIAGEVYADMFMMYRTYHELIDRFSKHHHQWSELECDRGLTDLMARYVEINNIISITIWNLRAEKRDRKIRDIADQVWFLIALSTTRWWVSRTYLEELVRKKRATPKSELIWMPSDEYAIEQFNEISRADRDHITQSSRVLINYPYSKFDIKASGDRISDNEGKKMDQWDRQRICEKIAKATGLLS